MELTSIDETIQRELNNDERRITRYQRLHIIRYKSKKLVKILRKYVNNSDVLEELKNLIADERDYFDFVDLIHSMKEPYRTQILKIFKSVTPIEKSSPYRHKMLVDIDNTTIENSDIAPIYYRDKDIVPGLAPVLLYFTGNGRSTTTFLSARPKSIELLSIRSIEKKISEDLRYSILTGTIKPICVYLKGKIQDKITDDESEIERSYQLMADEKYANFLELSKIFPHCRYIFMGDDTQGDPYLAHRLAETRDENGKRVCAWTAIRTVADKKLPSEIKNCKKILFHRSYYELMYRLIKKGYADCDNLLTLIEKDYRDNYDTDNYDQDQVLYDKKYLNKIRSLTL